MRRMSQLHLLIWLQVVLHPTPNSPKQSELHKMTVTKACPDQDLRIKLAIRMDKPQNMKHCGWATQSCFSLNFSSLSAPVASFLYRHMEKYCQVNCAPWRIFSVHINIKEQQKIFYVIVLLCIQIIKMNAFILMKQTLSLRENGFMASLSFCLFQVFVGFWEECLEALEETFLRPRASRSSDNDATMTLLEAGGVSCHSYLHGGQGRWYILLKITMGLVN